MNGVHANEDVPTVRAHAQLRLTCCRRACIMPHAPPLAGRIIIRQAPFSAREWLPPPLASLRQCGTSASVTLLVPSCVPVFAVYICTAVVSVSTGVNARNALVVCYTRSAASSAANGSTTRSNAHSRRHLEAFKRRRSLRYFICSFFRSGFALFYLSLFVFDLLDGRRGGSYTSCCVFAASRLEGLRCEEPSRRLGFGVHIRGCVPTRAREAKFGCRAADDRAGGPLRRVPRMPARRPPGS